MHLPWLCYRLARPVHCASRYVCTNQSRYPVGRKVELGERSIKTLPHYYYSYLASAGLDHGAGPEILLSAEENCNHDYESYDSCLVITIVRLTGV